MAVRPRRRSGTRRWIAMGAVAVLAAAAVAVLALTRGGPARAIDSDLSRLGSTDGLYTAPQIKAQAGFSLDQTAYAYASLAALGSEHDAPHAAAATLARLNASPEDNEVDQAYYARLLATAGVPVAEPSRADLPALWELAAATPDPEVSVQRYARLAELDSRVPARERRRIAAALDATVASREPFVLRARAQLFTYLGRRPDDAVQRTAAQTSIGEEDAADRVDRAAAIVESAAATGTAPAPAVRDALVSDARAAHSPQATYVALSALRAAHLPVSDLRPLADDSRHRLGARGAIAELAVFPTIPKAVWLVAHIRRAVGEDGLPERKTVRLSQALVAPDPRLREDGDDYAMLMAAANLAGLSYDAPGLAPIPAPLMVVRDSSEAMLWNVRGRVAADLRSAPSDVTVHPWVFGDAVDVAAVGALLHGADEVGTTVHMPDAFKRRFASVAPTMKFASVRWALLAAAGLDAIGQHQAAGALVNRYAKLGCSGYPLLVADGDNCDLESTLLALELRDTVPAAERLTRPMVAK